jgi:DNA mismatch endonuclease (patch repair protein)
MVDVHNSQTRTFNMSQIKGKNTKPEMLVRKFLFSKGFRYILYHKKLPGKPDIVLPKYKTVIFVNGCFWHGHDGCRYFVIPKTRTDWWRDKISLTKTNDNLNISRLEITGWQVIIIYECELKKEKIQDTLQHLLSKIPSR